MGFTTLQRFVTGLTVYDTYNGLDGTITQMNLNNDATNLLSAMYVGAYFVVTFTDNTSQLFNLKGRRVINSSGDLLPGVTLLTLVEKNALLGAGYPAS